MSRARILLTIVLPAMFAGGLVFGPALSSAHDGRDNLVAYADPGPETTYARHSPRPRVAQAPQPPKPPKPPRAPAPGIKINGRHIDLSGIDGMVRGQLDGVREMIKNNSSIPPPLRDKLLARIDKVRSSVDKRLAKLKHKRFDEIGSELEQLGDDIEQALDGLDEELEQLGEQIGKNIGKKLKDKKLEFDFKHDHDDENDNENDNDDDDDVPDTIPMTPDLDSADDGDMRDAINDLKGMAIKPQQKEQIAKIRAKSDQEVAAARRDIDDMSKKLETALGNPRTSDADISRYVDAISGAEARIRKARLIAWVSARRVLDDDQRKRIEAAAAKKKGN